MKILQNESTTNTTATANSTATKEKEKLLNQQHQQLVVEKRKAKTLKNKILQNVAQQLQQQQQLQSQQMPCATTATESTKAPTLAMTDDISAITTTLTVADDSERNNTTSNSFTSASIGNSKSKDHIKDTAASAKANSAKSKCNTNNNNNNKSNNSSSDFIIAEAAKILLKNGLNGSNAAAAAAVATATATLLTAAASFQLPHQKQQDLQQQQTSAQLSSTTSSALTATSSLKFKDSESAVVAANSATTAAAAAHAQLVAIAAAAAAVNATNNKRLAALTCTDSNNIHTSKSCPSNQQLNNGTTASVASSTESQSSLSPHFATPPFKSSGNIPTANSKTATTMSAMDMGVIDYTTSSAGNNNSSSNNSLASSPSSAVINLSTSCANVNSHHKYNNNSNISNHSHNLNRSDIGRPPVSSQPSLNNHNNNHGGSSGASGNFGGRLQFFKDGKFILELARSKDGEKSGWVSVPRKVFRTPSAATSSTITPSATASTAAPIIPTALTAQSPTVAVGITGIGVLYPKNECSNSLSFSDDNSSLQSSPWQRDHRWKQAAPRKNVSKEMTLFYHKPACQKFTTQALMLTQRKRRKPYDTKMIENDVLFRLKTTALKEQQQIVANDKFISQIEVETKAEEKNEDDKNEKEEIVGVNTDTKSASPATVCAKEESIADDDKQAKLSDKSNNVEMSKLLSPIKKEFNSSVMLNDYDKHKEDVEEMNTSDCDVNVDAPYESPLNGNVSNTDSEKKICSETKEKEATTECNKKLGDEEKRLTKQDTIKPRAKLTSIVQKLLDASASRIAVTAHHSYKPSAIQQHQPTSDTGSSCTTVTSSPTLAVGGSKHQNSKVSPPSNSATSRLVEYHQQHVSPRKRILRELEKVSLDDNATSVGGKRIRAKANSASGTAQHGSTSSSQTLTSPMNRTSPENGNNYIKSSSSAGTQPKNMNPAVSTAPSTKLYSSYSIHSLLGNGTSSCSLSPPSSSSKKLTDLPATITSNSLAYASYNSPSASHSSSYQSPMSPDGNTSTGGGGKSPSNTSFKQKRSPPYNSPLREAHSRSPTVHASSSGNHGPYDFGRRSPRLSAEAYNKLKYSGASETNGSQHHYHHVTQNFYAQYMASPHYVPPLGTSNSLSPATSGGGGPISNNTSNSRSPRHHSSAFRATTPTSSTIAALAGPNNSTQNIPSTQRGDMSPQRSATASPREATPRTVPKKTASIRRQFASPTSMSSTTTNANHTNSSCLSPNNNVENRNEENDRRTPVSHHQQHQQSLLQRSSPSSSNIQNTALNPYSYMYATNSPHPSNATHPVSAVSPTSANVSAAAAAAAAAAASYIPAVVSSPYYHPYISTLAAMRHPQMWMQHYQNAAAAAANPAVLQASRHPSMISAAAGAAAARLSPPYHGYQYNGVSNAAALAAAAAAAAGFGSSSAASSTHHSSCIPQGTTLAPPSSMFNPMVHNLVVSQSASLHPPTGFTPAAVTSALSSSAHSMTDTITTDFSKASKNNYSSSSSSSSLASSSPLQGTGISAGNSMANSMYLISNKDEQSSDVPLNLSKH